MKFRMFKIIFRTMTMIVMLFIVSLTACSCGEDTTVSSTPSENPSGDGSSDDYELGSGEIDGVEGTLEDERISISESSTESTAVLYEFGSADPNSIYDENDYGLLISVSNESGSEQIRATINIYGYIDYEADEIYAFNSDNSGDWIVHFGYCSNNCDNDSSWAESYDEESFNLIFSSIPSNVGEKVSGEFEIIFSDGSIVRAEFDTVLDVYVYQYL